MKYTIDELAVCENYELEKMENSLRDRVNQMKRIRKDSTTVETDLCYVQRELGIRYARAKWIAEHR